MAVGLLLLATGAYGVDLTQVEIAPRPDQSLEIQLVFSGPVSAPRAFDTLTPARIALDFDGVGQRLSRRSLPIGIGAVHSLVAVETSERARVVINLTEPARYEVTTEGERVRVWIETKQTQGATLVAREAAPAAPVSGPAPAVSLLPAAVPALPSVREIDFRQAQDGEGLVEIRLPSIDTKVAMREREDGILVQIMDTSLPRRLFRRLDVTEFGTPVVAIESKPSGRNVEVEIQTASALDYRAYQTDEVLTIELRALTPVEQARRVQAPASPEGERLSLSFQRIEIRALLQVLADFTDLNLVASDAVDERGSLMLRLKNVPWEQALDIILEAKDLAKCQEGNLVIVGPPDELPDCQERAASARASPLQSGPRHKRDSEVALTR